MKVLFCNEKEGREKEIYSRYQKSNVWQILLKCFLVNLLSIPFPLEREKKTKKLSHKSWIVEMYLSEATRNLERFTNWHLLYCPLSVPLLSWREREKEKDNFIVLQKVKWWNVITPLALSIIQKIVADSEATRNLMWFTNWYLLYCSLFLSFHYNCRAKGAEQTRAFDESQTNILLGVRVYYL